MIRTLLAATAVVVFSCTVVAPASAQFGDGNSANPLFSQYSAGGAGMYPAPHYSPQLGAQSYYTYQPLMPHEMMYQHSRNYYNYYNTGGYMGGNNSLNKTTVRWQSGTNHMGPLPFSTGLDSLAYKFNARRYCLDGNCGSGGLGLGGGHHGGGLHGGHIRGHFQGGHLRGGLRGRCKGGNCGGGVGSGGGEVISSAGCTTCGS